MGIIKRIFKTKKGREMEFTNEEKMLDSLPAEDTDIEIDQDDELEEQVSNVSDSLDTDDSSPKEPLVTTEEVKEIKAPDVVIDSEVMNIEDVTMDCDEQEQESMGSVKKISLKTPLCISIETILENTPVPSEDNKIEKKLQQLSNNAGFKDVLELEGVIEERIAQLESDYNKLQSDILQRNQVLERLEKISTLLNKVFNLKDNINGEELTYETYLEYGTVKNLDVLKQLIAEINSKSQQLEIAEILNSGLRDFIEEFNFIYHKHETTKQQIEVLLQESEVLAGEINRFALMLNKIKSMGQAGMNQYYKQLADMQEELTQKREQYLEKESKLNAYIPMLHESIRHTLESFSTYITPAVNILLEEERQLKEDNKSVLGEDITPERAQRIKESQEMLKNLHAQLSDCRKLHESFDAD